MTKSRGSAAKPLEIETGEANPQEVSTIMAEVYKQLRRMAGKQLRGRSHTLTPTALVHEVFLKLFKGSPQFFQDRSHFFAIAARCMRQLLADYARAKKSQKRGGGGLRVTFNEELGGEPGLDTKVDLVELDTVLDRLALQDERLARVVTFRFLAGLSIEETADAMSTSPTTIKRDWKLARVWLARELAQAGGEK